MEENKDAIFVKDLIKEIDFDKIAWQSFREGIVIYPFYKSKSSEASSALLKYEPGAEVPVHIHTGYEHILILSGSQEDERGIYHKGDLLINKPDSSHWVKSPDGCVVLAIWEKPVKFI
jgi:anti-sigma factor ChrR (cupin superfamily)